MAYKKNSYKEFDHKKNSCVLKIPLPPPITFGRSLK